MTIRSFVALMLSVSATMAQIPPAASSQAAPATGSISGVVKDTATGSPLAQLPIRVASVSTTSDAEGRYTLGNVPPGRHLVVAGTPTRSAPAYGSRAVTLAAGRDLRSIDFALPPKGTITGRVLDDNNEPVPGLEVVLIGKEYLAGTLHYYRRNVGFTNDNGEYRIQNVLPGMAYLILARRGNSNMNPISEVPADPKLRRKAAIPTYYPNAVSPEGATPVVLRPGEQREHVNVLMLRSPSYCIEGLLSLEGRPAELSFWIHEQKMSFGMGPSGFTTGIPPGGKSGPDGKFRICELHPGDYQLTAFSGDVNGPVFYGTTPVTITNSDVRNITVAPQPRLPLSGEVVWAGAPPDKPLNSQVSLTLTSMHRSFGAFAAGRCSIPGRFVVQATGERRGLLMDEYWVRARGLTGSLYLKDMTYGTMSVVREPLRLGSAIAGAELRVIIGHDGGFLRANVADKDGNALPNVNIILMPEEVRSEPDLAAMRITGQTDQDGSYASAALAPGKYLIVATSSAVADWSPESTAKLWEARAKAKEVEIRPNGTVQLTLESTTLN